MKIIIIALSLFFASIAATIKAQTPIEIAGGHQKTSLDVMFFKFFKKNNGSQSRFLFFNRNRVTIDYRQNSSQYLPVFGSTNAVSFNHKNLLGLAPVIVAQVLNRGIYSKAGLQYYYRKKEFTVFSWAVVELLKNPHVDLFALARFEPKITKNLHLYNQIELLSAVPTEVSGNFNFIQRLRVGLKSRSWQFGIAADFNQAGNESFIKTSNIGGFLRHEL
jgi:hypothetical protein